MKRQIITIDENKCNGCGKCVSACHEGAICMVNGKAKLLRDDYCDGLGSCLPACPAGAISFEEREAKPFDTQAVKEKMSSLLNTEIKEENLKAVEEIAGVGYRGNMAKIFNKHGERCPGVSAKTINPQATVKAETYTEDISGKETKLPCGCPGTMAKTLGTKGNGKEHFVPSQLRQWPVQIKLVPVNAPYFENADLLVAADCCAYSCGAFHDKYMKGKVVIIGCPKLDNSDYAEKLAAILQNNNIKSLTVVRMEVPCCAGIAFAAREAVKQSGENIKTKIVTLKIGK